MALVRTIFTYQAGLGQPFSFTPQKVSTYLHLLIEKSYFKVDEQVREIKGGRCK